MKKLLAIFAVCYALANGAPAQTLLDLAQAGTLWSTPANMRAEEMSRGNGSIILRLPGPHRVAPDLEGGEMLVRCRESDRMRQLVQIMIYNKGDDGPCAPQFFVDTVKKVSAALTEATGAEGTRRSIPSSSRLIDLRSWEWRSASTVYCLDVSSTGKREQLSGNFIRLQLAPAAKSPSGAMAFGSTGAAASGNAEAFERATRQNRVKKAELKDNVSKLGTGVEIKGIPMVDQGQKGYCAAAVMARLLEYYGLGTMDQHEMAATMNTSATGGTSMSAMKSAMATCGRKFGMRMETIDELDSRDYEHMLKDYNRATRQYGTQKIETPRGVIIGPDTFWLMTDVETLLASRTAPPDKLKAWVAKMKRYVDVGVPVIWFVTCGLVSDNEQRGGHMRLIVGYDDVAGMIYYSDTWGPGHECKAMSVQDAYAITRGRFVLIPL